jgi:hypothetical protein
MLGRHDARLPDSERVSYGPRLQPFWNDDEALSVAMRSETIHFSRVSINHSMHSKAPENSSLLVCWFLAWCRSSG